MNGKRSSNPNLRGRTSPGEQRRGALRKNGQPIRRHDAGRPRAVFANAQRNYERYVALARDAASLGDLIEAENCYQHAEHYFRVMRERAS